MRLDGDDVRGAFILLVFAAVFGGLTYALLHSDDNKIQCRVDLAKTSTHSVEEIRRICD